MWFCPKCNKANQGGFCDYCGTVKPNAEEESHGYVAKKTSGRDNKVIIVVCVVLAVAVIAAAAFVLGMMMKENQESDTSEKETTAQSEDKNNKDKKGDSNQGDSGDFESGKDDDPEPKQENNPETDSDTDPDSELPTPQTKEETNPEDATYSIYRNDTYGFYCAYPDNFTQVSPQGVNALKTFISEDGTVKMTIRASANSDSITTQEALNDFIRAYGGTVSYKSSGDTWYAVSVVSEGRSIYRKLFNENGSLYCMDFEMNAGDEDKYSPYIEYIEDNFKSY